MTERGSKGVRGILVDAKQNGVFVMRVFGEPDPATGRKMYVDYELRVDDLNIEITTDYYKLVQTEKVAFITYRSQEQCNDP